VPHEEGPWAIIKPHFVFNSFHGINYNNSAWSWGAGVIPRRALHIIDWVNVSDSLSVVIDDTNNSGEGGALRFEYDDFYARSLPDQPYGIYGMPLTRSHQIASEWSDRSLCLLIEKQITCSGGSNRYRMGGHAMQPRLIRRIIKIAPYIDGARDVPYCGQKYFKPCATVKYAMSLVESTGPWITFEFASGDYILNNYIGIDYAGITLQGSTTGTTRFFCRYYTIFYVCPQSSAFSRPVVVVFLFGLFTKSACLMINGPSCRINNIVFEGLLVPTRATTGTSSLAGTAFDAITINSFDIVITYCSMTFASTILRLQPASILTLAHIRLSAPGKYRPHPSY
jgi:hypothetical protein